jgi:broad specificity phosphatase PhoE
MEIFIARHGQTNLNKEKRLAGNTNLAQLNTKGREHAKKLAEFLADKKIEEIFSSPLNRARDTATPISDKINKKVKINKNLREFDFGIMDGRRERGKGKEGLVKRRVDLNYKFTKGDSYASTIKRVSKFIKKLLKKKYKKVLIVGHGGVNRSILTILTKQDLIKYPEKLDTINCPNDVIYKFNTKTKKLNWINTTTNKKGNRLLRRTSY